MKEQLPRCSVYYLCDYDVALLEQFDMTSSLFVYFTFVRSSPQFIVVYKLFV